MTTESGPKAKHVGQSLDTLTTFSLIGSYLFTVDGYGKIKVFSIPDIHEIKAIFMPRKEVAVEIVGMPFGIIFRFEDGKVEVIRWSSLDSAEYEVGFQKIFDPS